MSNGKVWRNHFSSEELQKIDSAAPGSLLERMARLLNQYSPEAPARADLTRLDRPGAQHPSIKRLDEGS
jgi:hypothetical protein